MPRRISVDPQFVLRSSSPDLAYVKEGVSMREYLGESLSLTCDYILSLAWLPSDSLLISFLFDRYDVGY